ncbi:hypothetical protein Egran_02466 [Elaphomyces granulatus]|uniref:SH3 domain-containing protein n=1 Tax=Elaphomyces granulatus TaxID=519963 RepID=A0A232M034_9EURO|nr:hypothetical protein Egran_02466 [Elaphomyces granulatus]
MPPNNRDHGLGAGLHERNWFDRLLGRAAVETVVSVVYVTAAPTFTGQIGGYTTLSSDSETGVIGLPMQVQVQQTSSSANPQPQQTTDPSSTQQATDDANSSTTSMATDLSSQTTTSSMTALLSTVTGAPTLLSSTRVSPVASGATSPSTENPISPELSMAAKAGLAIGILLLIGLLVGLALFWLHRERQKRGSVAEPDNEKSIPGNPTPASMSKPLPTPAPAPIVNEPVLEPSATLAVAATIPNGSSTAPSDPPQVGLRPVTQFAPDLGFGSGTDGSNAMVAGVIGAAAGTAAASLLGDNDNVNADKAEERPYTGSAHTPPQTSPKPVDGFQNPFNDPVNPFDPQTDTRSPPPTPPSKDNADIGQPRRESGVLPADLEAAVVSAAASVVARTVSTHEVDRSANLNGSPERSITPVSRPSTASADSSAGNASPVSVAATTATATAVAIGTAAPAPGPGNVHRVQLDFHPTLGDELQLHAGQLIRLIRDYDDGWARCIRLDGSKEGVVPRTCLSARPVKPRSPGPRGPPMMGPNGRPMSPAGGRFSPVPMGPPPMRPPVGPPRFYPDGRPVTPTHHGFPAPPRLQQGRPSSPGPRQFPDFPRPLSPGQGDRFPQQRSMSPGPYGRPGMQRPPVIRAERKRSSSVGGTVASNGLGNGLRGPSPLAEAAFPVRPQGPIGRKPVPPAE